MTNITEPDLSVGQRIELTRDADFAPYAIVRRGERGTVVYTDEQLTEVLLDNEHDGLADYDNKIWTTHGHPLEYRKLFSLRQYRKTFASAAALVLLMGSGMFHYSSADRHPIIDRQYQTLLSDTVAVGGTLEIEQSVWRKRTCFWTRARTWTDIETGRVMYRSSSYVHAGPANNGFEKETLSLKVPSELPRGRYRFESVGRGECSNGEVAIDATPSFIITIK
jgi:hypothetical protein